MLTLCGNTALLLLPKTTQTELWEKTEFDKTEFDKTEIDKMKIHGHHQELVERYNLSVSQNTSDIFSLTYIC